MSEEKNEKRNDDNAEKNESSETNEASSESRKENSHSQKHVDEIKKENATLKLQLEETDDRLKRIAAEFDNYKKRSSKEKEDLYHSIMGDVVSKFLPVIDNLEKAVEVKTEDEGYKQGIELVLKQFKDVLEANGVTEIKAIGETFNPELHEAVSTVQDSTKQPEEIVQEYRKGYMIGNKVIRHSMVVVAN